MTNSTKLNRSDLKFFPSERLTDDDEGGGQPLGTPIQGVANEIFNPISSIARVNGAFYARQIYAGVQRADSEPLIGPFVALTKPPKDPNVSYLLFKSGFGEMRKSALKRIEAFNVATIESKMTLLSNPTKGSRIIQTYQRVGETLPQVGDVYCLRQDKKGYEQIEQYVQVTSVKSETRTFTTKDGKEFDRLVISLELTQPLSYDFIGADYPDITYIDNPCKVRETHVANAASYYGIKPVVAEIKQAMATIKVPSLMEKIIPTSQIETPLINITAAGRRQTLIDGSKDKVTITINKQHNAGDISSLFTGNAITPNSLIVKTSIGELNDKDASLSHNGVAVGAVDYAKGLITLSSPSFSARLDSLSFKPAGADLQVADTAKIDVRINNRSYGYVMTLDPIPAVGSVQVSYRSQGQWYDLIDTGAGNLTGTAGSGTMNYATGSLSVSFGELPDVDSAILISYGTQARYFNRSNTPLIPYGQITLEDAHNLVLKWTEGDPKTAQASATGKITGDITGRLDNGVLKLDRLLPPKTRITATYNVGEKTYQEHKAPLRDRQGKVPIDLGDVPITRGSVRLRWNLLIESFAEIELGDAYDRRVTLVDPYKTVRDDGNGKLVDESGVEVGTIDYDNRRLLFSPDTTVKIPKARYIKTKIGEKVLGSSSQGNTITQQVQDIYRISLAGYEYIDAMASMPIDESAMVEVWFYEAKAQKTAELSFDSVVIPVTPYIAETVMPMSVHFTQGSRQYFDKLGQICTELNPATNQARVVGTIDYQSGLITLTDWGVGEFKLSALATSIDINPIDGAYFRTPVAPIRPASLQIMATGVDGKRINATADLQSKIKGKGIDGVVDVETGVVSVRFGEWVVAVGNESEYWYDADAIVDGKLFKPAPVFAHSITVNAVAYSYLPIDSDIIKIDTVRLPQDGQVPIFRRGDTILITNTQEQSLGSAFQAGQTVQLDRQNLDRICLTDSNGKAVLATLWGYDLAEGTITFNTPLDLSGYVLPLIAKHTIEERNRIVKADIDGTLSLHFATKHNYPLEGTYVSSVLMSKDLRVSVSVPFTQRNWNKVWSDKPVGEQLLNKLNLRDYPMVLTDDGAITERWLIKWASAGQFELYGEQLGFVGKFDTLTDLAPINPATAKPYFIIPKEAFGNKAPWEAQDVIRFDTTGTLLPLWVLCAVQPNSDNQKGEDGFTVCLFGDTTEK